MMSDAEVAAGLPATSNYRYADRVGAQLFVAGNSSRSTASSSTHDPGGCRGATVSETVSV